MNNLDDELLNPNSFIIRINHYVPQYEAIRSRLSEKSIYNIEHFPSKDPAEVEEMVEMDIPFYKDGGVEISFTRHCNFQDLYLLINILRDFIDSIWVIKGTMKIVRIGTDLYEKVKHDRAIAYPISIKSFLEIDPKLSTDLVIDDYFIKIPNNDQIDDREFDEYEYQGYILEDEYESYTIKTNQYDRDSFDAMADGQLGDYDDFKGDIDDVKTWAGRD